MPILSKTQLFPAMTSLPLGTDTEASLSPALNANPRGFQIATLSIPLITSYQQEPSFQLSLYSKVISLGHT